MLAKVMDIRYPATPTVLSQRSVVVEMLVKFNVGCGKKEWQCSFCG